MQKPIFSNKKIKAENKYLQAIQKDFIDSKGRKGNIITLKSTKSGNGSFILALTKDKKIIVNKEYQFGCNDFVYKFPSGFVENGISASENIKKELEEESGYTSNDKIIKVGEVNINGYYEGNNELFFATNCYKNKKQKLEVGEEIETYLFTLEEFENMVLENKVTDVYTIVNFYLAKEKTNNFKI